MTGITNQIQTPLGSSVNSILGNASNNSNGISLIPANPSISFGGNWPGSLFTVWEAATLAAGNYTPVVLAHFDDVTSNGNGVPLSSMTGTLNLGSIQAIHNAFSVTANGITSFSAPSLIQSSSDFSPTMTALTSLSIPLLKYVGGSLVITANSLTSFSAPALIAVNNNLGPISTGATTVSFPNLVFIGSGCAMQFISCTSLDLSSLQYVAGFTNAQWTSLTTLSLPSIITLGLAGFAFAPTVTNLVTFSFGSTLKTVGGNVTMTGAKLSQASVDGILVSLAALDGTGGTTAYSSLTINLSGGSSSAPSATGLAAKATLVGRSCTVTTN